MREFEVPFREGLTKGLRTSEDNPRNKETLVELLNAKPTGDSPTPIVPVTYSITDAAGTVSWPFPQLFEVSD